MGGYFLLLVDHQCELLDGGGLKYGIDRNEQNFNISVTTRCAEHIIM
jgi:hypothetical protein